MKSSYSILALLVVLSSCSSDLSAPSYFTETVVGTWTTILPKKLIGKANNYEVGISIRIEDSAYTMYVLEQSDPGKPIFNQYGSWRMLGDSICLSGDSGTMLDTLTQGLKDIPDSIAQIPVYLSVTRTEINTWPVRMENLSAAINAMPLNEGQKNQASGLTLPLQRP